MSRKPVDMLKLTAISLLSIGLTLSMFSSFQTVEFSNASSLSAFLIVGPDGKRFQGFFSSIQEAINQAENGSCVYISPNTYYEHVVVNKTISLIGENVSTTIIDGYPAGTIVTITADNVTIAGFTIQNSGWGWYRNGIYVYRADNCEIKNNFLLHNCQNIRLNCSQDSRVLDNTIDGDGYGIRLINSFNCMAIGNNVSNCIGGVHLQNATSCTVKRNCFTQNSQGVRLYSPCLYNKIMANTVYNNTYDGMIERMPPNETFFGNIFFHNNFINNTHPFIYKVSGNVWDDGYPSGGNYWSRYNGTDLFSGTHQDETGNDGIGDTSYAINSFDVDRYPLIHPYGSICNLDTNLTYLTIQSAIDASETLNRHTLWVESGVYHENVNVHKSLTLIGENRLTTIIDSDHVGTVLSVNADNVSIAGFTVRDSGLLFPPYGDDRGVFLDHSSGCNISRCLITNNRIGVYLFFSEDNVIEHNVVSCNSENGILLWYSGNNVLNENEILNNSYNFGVSGGSFSDFNNTIAPSNTVDGKPIRYVIGVEDEIFDNQTNIGVLYVINGINVTVRNLNLAKNRHGLFCYNVTDSRIEYVTALENSYGIYLQDSSGNIINSNRCLKAWVGICLQDSDYNVVEENTAGDSEKGISLYEADYNSLRGNNVLNNLYGVRLYSSHFNEFFHNNIIENTNQADLISSYPNVWDNGFEGNFWSDYIGPDTNRDGLGDTPRIIDDDNSDRYPLLGSFCNVSIYYEENFHRVPVISNSTVLSFIFEATNNTIRLTVNGTDETYGFCRMCIPHILIEPEIAVIIDDGLTEVLYPNFTIRDDGFCRWICFAYQHTKHEILIIPEFSPVFFLLTLLLVALWCSSLKKLKNEYL
jgi:parallel beta-helix repeat protein